MTSYIHPFRTLKNPSSYFDLHVGTVWSQLHVPNKGTFFFLQKKCTKFWNAKSNLGFQKKRFKRGSDKITRTIMAQRWCFKIKVEKANPSAQNRQTRSFFLLRKTFFTFSLLLAINPHEGPVKDKWWEHFTKMLLLMSFFFQFFSQRMQKTPSILCVFALWQNEDI